MRRWNQTGQKYAGGPDISSRILPVYTWLLWLLILATYIVISLRISHRAAAGKPTRQINLLSTAVCFAALAFKVAFTAADAPELLQGVGVLSPVVVLASSISLVAQARVVFVGIAQLLAYATYCHSPWKQKADRKGMLLLEGEGGVCVCVCGTVELIFDQAFSSSSMTWSLCSS